MQHGRAVDHRGAPAWLRRGGLHRSSSSRAALVRDLGRRLAGRPGRGGPGRLLGPGLRGVMLTPRSRGRLRRRFRSRPRSTVSQESARHRRHGRRGDRDIAGSPALRTSDEQPGCCHHHEHSDDTGQLAEGGQHRPGPPGSYRLRGDFPVVVGVAGSDRWWRRSRVHTVDVIFCEPGQVLRERRPKAPLSVGRSFVTHRLRMSSILVKLHRRSRPRQHQRASPRDPPVRLSHLTRKATDSTATVTLDLLGAGGKGA